MSEVDDLRIERDHATDDPDAYIVEFKTPYGWVPFRSLGYGYQSTITWLCDFAARLFQRYPDAANPLAMPAICLVDEIDLHLHPVWQRKIASHLLKVFPGTQFIVTAHSPLVVQSVEDANLAVLRREGDHVVIDQSVQGVSSWRIDQILASDLFGVPLRSESVERELEKRKELLGRNRLKPAERKELARLNAMAEALPVGDTTAENRALDSIQRALKSLQANGGNG